MSSVSLPVAKPRARPPTPSDRSSSSPPRTRRTGPEGNEGISVLWQTLASNKSITAAKWGRHRSPSSSLLLPLPPLPSSLVRPPARPMSRAVSDHPPAVGRCANGSRERGQEAKERQGGGLNCRWVMVKDARRREGPNALVLAGRAGQSKNKLFSCSAKTTPSVTGSDISRERRGDEPA